MAQGEEVTGAALLSRLSEGLAEAVAKVAPSIVRVDDGSRLTATGIIFEADGIIVATSHGVERDDEVTVITRDGTRHAATVLGRDPDTDIAVLKVQATGLPAIAQATEAEVKIGQLAVAVGEPGGMGLTATLGLVSGLQETETNGTPEYILTTDAVLYPGFSGGALIGADGTLLGLLNRLYGQGIGVALGTPLVARVVEQIKVHGGVKRGYLGIRTQLVALPDSLRVLLGIVQERALLVVQAESGSPADTGGLLLGDTLLALDGTPVEDVDGLRQHLVAGRDITVTIVRGGERRDVTLTVGGK